MMVLQALAGFICIAIELVFHSSVWFVVIGIYLLANSFKAYQDITKKEGK